MDKAYNPIEKMLSIFWNTVDILLSQGAILLRLKSWRSGTEMADDIFMCMQSRAVKWAEFPLWHAFCFLGMLRSYPRQFEELCE